MEIDVEKALKCNNSQDGFSSVLQKSYLYLLQLNWFKLPDFFRIIVQFA